MATGGKSAALLFGMAALAAILFSSKARAQSTQAEPGPVDDADPPFAPYVPHTWGAPLEPLPAADLTPIDFPALDFDSWLFDPLPNIMPATSIWANRHSKPGKCCGQRPH